MRIFLALIKYYNFLSHSRRKQWSIKIEIKNFSHFYTDLILWRARKSASKVKIFFSASVHFFPSLSLFLFSFFQSLLDTCNFSSTLEKSGWREKVFISSVLERRLIFRVLVRIIALWIFLDFRSLARSFSISSFPLVSHQSVCQERNCTSRCFC